MSIEVVIPEWKTIRIENVLFDMNGTLAVGGKIAPSTRERLARLADVVQVYVMSADTHGTLEDELSGLPLTVKRVGPGIGASQKRAFLEELGPDHTVAVGNGRNDVAMLQGAVIGIVIIGLEGAAQPALLAAELVFPSIDAALDCLLMPKRLVATLRG